MAPEYYTIPAHLLNFHRYAEEALAKQLLKKDRPIAFPRVRESDQQDDIIQQFYAQYAKQTPTAAMNPLQKAYVRIARYMAEQLGYVGSVYYQATPTCRVQRPNDIAVGEWHRDRDYGHNPKEVNVFMPLHETREENTIHIEYMGKRKAYPVERGQVLVFDGANQLHGNVLNTSVIGRVSFDFRLLHSNDYVAGGKTINGARTFELGSYWQELFID